MGLDRGYESCTVRHGYPNSSVVSICKMETTILPYVKFQKETLLLLLRMLGRYGLQLLLPVPDKLPASDLVRQEEWLLVQEKWSQAC